MDPNYQADKKVGETQALVKHCRQIAAKNQDTTVDSDWPINDLGFVDVYCAIILLLAFIKALILYIPVAILACIPVGINYIKYRYFSFGEHAVRHTAFWKFHVTAQWILSLPLQVLIISNLLLDYLLMFIFGGLYCTFSWNWVRWYRNQQVLAPYKGGPNLYLHFADIVNVVGSMSVRLQYFEFMKNFVMMFLMNHWWKYWIIANPYVTELGERFVNQIGESMADLPVEEINQNFQRCISWSVLSRENREEIDAAFFCPHYPYPPCGRRYAIGMQSSNLITTFVHTSHFQTDGTAMFSLSNSAQVPVYRVMLWYNNPWHIMTGYVEANISSVDNGLEHPMWLIAGHNRIASDGNYDWSFNPGFIDIYFNRYMPVIQKFIRGNIVGWEQSEV